MKVTKDSYRKMNKGYNAIFDGLQEIEDITPEISMAMNQALNILDACLDEVKKCIAEDTPQSPEKPEANAQGFSVFGGK